MSLKPKFFITTTIPSTFVFFRDNLRFLNEQFDVCAISSEKKQLHQIGEREGIRTALIPMKREISLFDDFISFLNFIKLFIKERPDIVHGNTPKAAMLSMLAAKLTGVKVRIYVCHGLRFEGATGLMRKLLIKMEQLTCSCASRVLCVSKGVQSTLVNENIVDAEKALVIHHGSAGGLNLELFSNNIQVENHIRIELGISPDAFVFIFVGRLVRDKGLNELISAFSNLQEEFDKLHLILVGEEDGLLDPISSTTRSQINNLSKIHKVGWQKDIRPYLATADAFVFPSYREGFGMVLLEAGAMGLPSITTDISGCNEIILDGINGEIIPPKDAVALLVKMHEWVTDNKKIAKMSQNARELVATRFERNLVWRKYLEEYKRLLQNTN